MQAELFDEINALVAESNSIIVCSVDENGFPNAKAMFKTEHDGLKTFLFSTNTSSMRVGQFRSDPKASLYFCDKNEVHGLMLVGSMEVCTDHDLKARLWAEGNEKYYPLGIDDPDYCVLRFTAQSGNFYARLQKHVFEIA
jgi:pyridoxamine 5'-phosphate oxidase